MATARLPNPNIDHLEGQHITLREALVHQESTAMWSRNTDINTFKGMVTNKENLESIKNQGVGGVNEDLIREENKKASGTVDKLSKTISKSFKDAFSVLGSSLDKFTVTLNGVKFSDFADSFSAGSSRIKTGMKELTNGLGVMGPIINNLKTALYKVQAVFNVLAGALQMVFGIIPKIFSRLFERKRDKDDGKLEKIEEEINQLTQQRDGDKTEHTKKMEALLVKLHPDSIHALDSIINGSGSGGSSATYFDDYRLEEEQRQHSERQKKYDKEIYELEKKRQKALARKDRMNSMFGFAKFAIMIAALVAIVILLKDKIGSLFKNIFDTLTANGYFGAIGNAASQFATRTASLFDELSKGLRNIFGPGNSTSNPNIGKPNANSGGGGSGANPPVKSASTILDSTGKPFEVATDAAASASNTRPSMSGRIAALSDSVSETLKSIAPKIAKAGAVTEVLVDGVINEKKYNDIKEAYELQLPIKQNDGTMAPISKEQMADVDSVMINNRAGSAGRGFGSYGGGSAGAAAGFALTSWIPIPGARVVGTIAGGIIGAVLGGKVGDDVTTGASEYLTDTDMSQEILNGTANLSADALKNAEEQAKKAAAAAEEMKATANSNVVMDSSTRNFIQQETMFHGGQTDKRDVMIQNSYLNSPIGPIMF